MRRFTAFVLLLTAGASSAADTSKPLTRIGFGSCAHQEKPQPIWDAIVASKPDIFLCLGDNIYGDSEDMSVLKAKYDKAAAVPGYQKLLKICPVLATWDDHDYGKNDAGVEYAQKDQSQQLFLDFYGIPKDSPKRTQKGVYDSVTYGPEGQRVQIIILDLRYFRSPLKRGKRSEGMTYTPYIANNDADATVLGEAQWKWLEDQFKKPAEVRLLVSSVQLIAEDHGFEKWMNFPGEREKLFKMIRDTKANGIIALSGDRHLAELSQMTDVVGYPLYDLTSSGLNQASKTWRASEKNRHRVSGMPWGDNYGLITIDWAAADPTISLQIRDVVGELTIREQLPLSLLTPGKRAVKVPEEEPKVSEGSIAPKAALEKIGDKVTVEMKVNSVGGTKEKRMFLNSLKNFSSKESLAIVCMPKAFGDKYAKATAATFLNKTIRVTGVVSTFRDSIQIVVDDEKQLEIVEATPAKE